MPLAPRHKMGAALFYTKRRCYGIVKIVMGQMESPC